MQHVSSTLLIILSVIGFLLSFYIFYKKKRKEKLVCIIGKDCNKVINSKYARFFFASNEVIGMVYYTLIFITTLIFLSSPLLLTSTIVFSRAVIVGIAALFSIYLSIVQVFVLKELCDYCLAANIINIILFIALFF